MSWRLGESAGPIRRTPIARMSKKRRDKLDAAGNPSPFSTFSNTGSGLSRIAVERDRKPTPKQPHNTGPSVETVTLLFHRDQGRCARCGDPIRGERGRDWSVQHRRARQGRDVRPDTNQPQNLVLLGGSATTGCHGHVESHRAEARVNGWAIRQTDDPAEVPVNHAVHGRVLLTADGTYTKTCNPNHTNHDRTEVTA